MAQFLVVYETFRRRIRRQKLVSAPTAGKAHVKIARNGGNILCVHNSDGALVWHVKIGDVDRIPRNASPYLMKLPQWDFFALRDYLRRHPDSAIYCDGGQAIVVKDRNNCAAKNQVARVRYRSAFRLVDEGILSPVRVRFKSYWLYVQDEKKTPGQYFP